jgi:hypothetical protein
MLQIIYTTVFRSIVWPFNSENHGINITYSIYYQFILYTLKYKEVNIGNLTL